jgi:hypothetical protein
VTRPDPVQPLAKAAPLWPSGSRMPIPAAAFTVVPIITPATDAPPPYAPADAREPRPRHAARPVRDKSVPPPGCPVSSKDPESPETVRSPHCGFVHGRFPYAGKAQPLGLRQPASENLHLLGHSVVFGRISETDIGSGPISGPACAHPLPFG